MKIFLALLLISYVSCFWSDVAIKTCSEHCALPITWDHEEWACGTDNNSYKNALCNMTLSTVYNCLIKNDIHVNPNVGIVYPGQCGCPLYCSSYVNQGTCQNGACECSPGWAGIDCTMVTDGNICSGQGTVITVNGFKMCECVNGYAGNDCSVAIGTLPPIDQTILPVQQYSDWDDYQNDNPIFNDTTIAQIYLKTAPETLAFFLDPVNIHTEVYMPADMVYYNGIVTEVMDQVGYRIKGGASRGYAKKSFKIAFDEYVDRKWDQQKKIGLKAMEMDPSALKEKLTESLLYSMNAPAQRSSYAQFFINDQFMGIYLILENIDGQFLKSRFGNEDGLLYKCTGDLAYLGWNPEIYKNLTMGRGENEGPTYEAQTDLAEDYTLLRDFIFVINITDDTLFANELEKIFDVDLFVRTLAVEVLTGNWDGLWNGNNYFLYYNPAVSKFQYFRQDLDVAFGVWDTFYGMIDKPVYTWGDGGRGYRLINRVLAYPTFKASFTNYCYQLINTYYKTIGSFTDRMFFINQEIRPIVARDKWRETDFAWSFDEFASQPLENIVRIPGENWATLYPEIIDYGLLNFMNERISTALAELDPPSPK